MKKALFIALMLTRLVLGEYVYLPSASEGVLTPYLSNYYIWGYASTPPSSDLEVWYDFAPNGSESTITLDISGNSRTGTVVGAGVVYQPSTNGLKNTYLINGTAGSAIRIGGANATDFTVGKGNFLFSTWIKVNTHARYDGVLGSRVGTHYGEPYNLLLVDNPGSYNWLATSVGNWLAGSVDPATSVDATFANVTCPTNSYQLGQWHHLVIKGTSGKAGGSGTNWMYINNQLVAYKNSGIWGASTMRQADYFYLGLDDYATSRTINADYAYAQMQVSTNINDLWSYDEIVATNQAQKVTLGILSPWVLANAYSSNVLSWTSATLITDGSGKNQTISTASAPALGGGGVTRPQASFDGAGNLITVADVASLDVTNAVTLRAFVKPTSIADNERIIDKGLAYWMGVSNSLWKVKFGTYEVNAGTATTGAWTDLCSTFDGTTLTLYTNGVSAGTDNTGVMPTANATAITIGSSGAGDYYHGLMSRVVIQNDDLTSGQVLSMNTAEKGDY